MKKPTKARILTGCVIASASLLLQPINLFAQAGSAVAKEKAMPSNAASSPPQQTIRSAKSKDESLHGLGAVELRVVLVAPEARNAIEQSKFIELASQSLRDVGVKLLDTEGPPILILSVDTLDVGNGLVFNIRLELGENVVLQRKDGALKVIAKSWDTSQFGSSPYSAATPNLTAAAAKCFKKFTDAFRQNN